MVIDMAESIPEDLESRVILMLNWRRRAIRASNGHYRSSNYCKHWSNFLTSFNIVSAIAVLFFTNNRFFGGEIGGDGPSSSLLYNSDLYTAIAGLFVVLTTALQYVLRLEIKSRDAKSAGNDFTSIKREIELLLVDSEVSMEKARAVQISHTHASKNHELVPRKLWISSADQTKSAFEEDKQFEDSIIRKFGIVISIDD